MHPYSIESSRGQSESPRSQSSQDFWLGIYELADVIGDEVPCPERVAAFVAAYSSLPSHVQAGLKKNRQLLLHVLEELDSQLRVKEDSVCRPRADR